MDNEELVAVLVHVDFDEVVAAAKSANASLNAVDVFQVTVAPKLVQHFETNILALAHLSARGDMLTNGRVEGGEVDVDLSEFNGAHTAPDVYTHDVRNHLVTQVGGEADYTPGSCVDIGHDTNLAVSEDGLLHESVNLVQGFGFDIVSEDFKVTHFVTPPHAKSVPVARRTSR